eukprot:scaffold34710_cov208-Amphora_coffeaeformis.AAC.6
MKKDRKLLCQSPITLQSRVCEEVNRSSHSHSRETFRSGGGPATGLTKPNNRCSSTYGALSG